MMNKRNILRGFESFIFVLFMHEIIDVSEVKIYFYENIISAKSISK